VKEFFDKGSIWFMASETQRDGKKENDEIPSSFFPHHNQT